MAMSCAMPGADSPLQCAGPQLCRLVSALTPVQARALSCLTLPTLTRRARLQKCAKRVESDTTGEAHCTGQYFDYWKCVDKCVRFSLLAFLPCSRRAGHESAVCVDRLSLCGSRAG